MHIGILGGGQLARMLAEAGFSHNFRFTFIDPKADACAGARGRLIVADWSNSEALTQLARCDRVTFDFENVPDKVLRHLAGSVPVSPGPEVLAGTQDRLAEKRLFTGLGIPVAPFVPVDSRPDLLGALEETGLPAVLKTRRMGYDGKGQAVLRDKEDLETAWQRLGDYPLIIESLVEFDYECALTAVRDADGQMRFYPLTRTLHEEGILSLCMAPFDHDGKLQQVAESHLARIAGHFEYVGALTLEFFVRDGRLLANEIAPRVHNSAHWTIEGASCSQFENHLRAVCGLPLGSTTSRGRSVMVNWIGEMPDPARYLKIDGLAWHDYGKKPRPGRKVGHATISAPDEAGLRARLEQLQEVLPPELAGRLPGLLC